MMGDRFYGYATGKKVIEDFRMGKRLLIITCIII
jgi:hypothetical protein